MMFGLLYLNSIKEAQVPLEKHFKEVILFQSESNANH